MYAKKSVAIGRYADGNTGYGHAAAKRLAPKFFVRLVPKTGIDEGLQRLRTALHKQRTDALGMSSSKQSRNIGKGGKTCRKVALGNPSQHVAARIRAAPMAHGEGGAVGKERGVAHKDGVVLGAEAMHAHKGVGRGNKGCRNFGVLRARKFVDAPAVYKAVGRARPFKSDKRPAKGLRGDEFAVECQTFFFQYADSDLHAAAPQYLYSASRNLGKGVDAPHYAAAESLAHYHLGAGRRATEVGAGLETNVDGTFGYEAAQVCLHAAHGVHLGVGRAALAMPALADNFIIVDYHRAYHRIGRSRLAAVFCQLYAAAHPFFVKKIECHYIKFIILQEMNEIFQYIYNALRRRYESGEARALAFALLEDGFGVERTAVYADKVSNFGDAEHKRLNDILSRMENGAPLQYAIGKARFRGEFFKTNPAVLIPRPETEELVELCVAWCKDFLKKKGGGAPLRILDAGTGSGCIAICLAKETENKAYVEAWDISEEALAVAKENADLHGAKVVFKKRDILNFKPETSFDLIVSNPPYITDDERKDMEAHVLDYEPHAALFVPNDDPLLFYRALAKLAKQRLAPEGMIAVETNRMYADEVARLFKENGLEETQTIKDCFGNKRFAVGRNILL